MGTKPAMKELYTVLACSVLIITICPLPSNGGSTSKCTNEKFDLSETSINEITKRVTKEVVNIFNIVTPKLAKKSELGILLSEFGYAAVIAGKGRTTVVEPPGLVL